MLVCSLAICCQAASPPYASVSVLHTTERDLFLQAGGGSLYDTNGLVNGATGDLFHSSMACTLGWVGDANCRVNDTMMIPFPSPVTRSDYYDVSVSGTVTVGIYNVGQNAFLGSHWGDFSVWMRDASIRDVTTGSIVYSGLTRNIYYSKTSLWAALEPAVWGSVELMLEQYFPLVAADKYIEAGLKLKEAFDTIDSIANAVQTITTNYTTSATVFLEAGHTYRIEPHIDSTVSASSVDLIAGGHFSGVKGTMHISDISVVSHTPYYTLSVESSGASGVIINASPADSNGKSSGTAPTTFTYLSGTGISVTVPSTIGTKVFTGWSGVDNQNGNTAFLLMNANRTANALYSETTVTVYITSPTTFPTWTNASDCINLHCRTSASVTNVTWVNTSNGQIGGSTTDGANNWTTVCIPLQVGANNIVVTARNSANRTATDSITVTYDDTAKELPIHAQSMATFGSGSPDQNHGGSLEVGFINNASSMNIRSVLQYSLATVPPGSVVLSARLGLRTGAAQPINAPQITITAYRNTESWSQNNVTWNNQPVHTTSDGISVGVGSTRGAWSYWDVGPIVSRWWSGASANYGFKLVSNVENSSSTNERLFDNEILRVVYIPDPGLPTITINSPTSASQLYYTNATPSITLQGSSSDKYDVASVTWANATTAQGGNATGTTSWSASVTLTQGWNAVTVTAVNLAGNAGVAAIDIFYALPDTNAPSVPNNVTATTLSSTQAKVAWSPCTDTGGSGFKEYRIYRNGLLRTNSQFTTFTDVGLSPSSGYCYTVTGVDVAGNESSPSSTACVSTKPPIPPSLALIQPQSGGSFTFRLTSTTGYTYIMESSMDLQAWTYVGALVITNGTTDITLTKPPGPPRNFYRVKFVP